MLIINKIILQNLKKGTQLLTDICLNKGSDLHHLTILYSLPSAILHILRQSPDSLSIISRAIASACLICDISASLQCHRCSTSCICCKVLQKTKLFNKIEEYIMYDKLVLILF